MDRSRDGIEVGMVIGKWMWIRVPMYIRRSVMIRYWDDNGTGQMRMDEDGHGDENGDRDRDEDVEKQIFSIFS